jgi:protein TonB
VLSPRVLDTRLAAGLVVAVVGHALALVALGAFPQRDARPTEHSELVVVHVVPARPDPVQDVPPPAEPPPPVASTPPPRPTAKQPRAAPRPRPVVTLRDDRSDAPALPAVSAPPEPEAVPAAAEPAPAPAPAAPTLPGPAKAPSVKARPRYRVNPRPEYPIQSLRRREEGVVLLDVNVRPSGTPAAVALRKTSGHPELDKAAIEAVWRWSFEPARVDGTPIASDVVVPVRFSLSSP